MNTPTNKGFTLIEMITVLAIFTIMTSIVIFNHNKFTSETILTNMAYEVALSVREAQIYGVSVRNPAGVSGSDFNKEFGIHFPYVAGGSADYYLFADAGTLGDNKFTGTGTGCTAGTGECVTPYTLQRGVKIVDVQVKPSNGAVCEGASDNDLSVLFKRPDPEPLFDNESNVYEFAEITLRAQDGALRFVVVYSNGQINVDNNSVCP